jgi:hypothetical protein
VEKQSDSDRGRRRPKQIFKSFAELAREIRESGDELELHVYPSLTFGAIWWIPDEATGFGSRGEHPWIIVVPYRPGQPVVVACPRTSQVEHNREKGLLMPAGIIAGLDREGVVLLEVRRALLARSFRDYRHAGSLPDSWKQELWSALNRWAERARRWSEEP